MGLVDTAPDEQWGLMPTCKNHVQARLTTPTGKRWQVSCLRQQRSWPGTCKPLCCSCANGSRHTLAQLMHKGRCSLHLLRQPRHIFMMLTLLLNLWLGSRGVRQAAGHGR